MVHQVLTNEKYIGNNVYNRISFKLKKKRVRNATAMWVRRDNVLERSRRYSDDELLTKLRALLTKHGSLSAELIDGDETMPSSSAYQSRFGSLIKAYQRVGSNSICSNRSNSLASTRPSRVLVETKFRIRQSFSWP